MAVETNVSIASVVAGLSRTALLGSSGKPFLQSPLTTTNGIPSLWSAREGPHGPAADIDVEHRSIQGRFAHQRHTSAKI
jgi:hypothetical protein